MAPSYRAVTTAAVLALAAFSVVTAACGVPAQSSPRIIPAASVPFGLMEATTSTTQPAQPSQVVIPVYLVSGIHLVAVNRLVAAPAGPPAVLASLLGGPTNAETAAGIGTDIPAGTAIHPLRTQGSTAFIDISDSFATVTGQNQILAIAQIVFTLTELPGIAQVAFELGGASTEVPDANGTLQNRAVNRSDFGSLAPGIPVR